MGGTGSPLWNVVVVKLQIVEQGRLRTGSTAESGLLQKLADTAVESFGHAIVCGCRGGAGRCSMLMPAQTLLKACWRPGFLSFVVKRSVNCEPLPVRSLMILIGEANVSRRRGRRCFCRLVQRVMQ